MKSMELSEQAISTVSYDEDDGQNALVYLEGDVGDLLRKLAKAEHDLQMKNEAHEKEMRKVLLGIINVMDSFDRVFVSVEQKQDLITKQMKKWLSNFRTIEKLLKQLLRDKGVSRIENLDEGFDPEWHTAVEVVEDETKTEGTIVEEEKPGYVWNNIILRPSEVVVIKK